MEIKNIIKLDDRYLTQTEIKAIKLLFEKNIFHAKVNRKIYEINSLENDGEYRVIISENYYDDYRGELKNKSLEDILGMIEGEKYLLHESYIIS